MLVALLDASILCLFPQLGLTFKKLPTVSFFLKAFRILSSIYKIMSLKINSSYFIRSEKTSILTTLYSVEDIRSTDHNDSGSSYVKHPCLLKLL